MDVEKKYKGKSEEQINMKNFFKKIICVSFIGFYFFKVNVTRDKGMIEFIC